MWKKIPKIEERREIIERVHLLGHFMCETTFKRVNENFWWKSLRADVEHVVSQCETCHRHQKGVIYNHPANAVEMTGLGDRIGIDCVWGFPETSEGYTGILVVVEALSDWPAIYPLKTKEKTEIASNLMKHFADYGPPKIIISDRGTEFVNDVVKALCELTGVEHRVTSAYNPRANGLTERQNQTVVNV